MKKIKKYNEYIDTDIYTDIEIKSLIDKVEFECGNKSDLNIIYENSNYKEIINIGTESIPHILENFTIKWIKALEEITKVKLYEDFSLSTQDMKNIWLKWAKENGY